MAALDAILGALLIGSYVNSYLFMVEILQVYRYFRSYPGDHIVMKGVVLITFLIDTLSTLGNYSCVYLYTITHWGDESYLVNQYWPMPVYLITTGMSAFIVQSYLNYRYWTLARNIIVSPLLLLSSLTALGGSIATTIIVVKYSLYNQRSEVRIPVTIWLVASAASDIAITVALIVQLQRLRSQALFKSTESLMNRLTTSAIKTGSPGATLATISLIIYLNNPDENVSVGLAFCLGRIYCLTMMKNLNSRVSSNERYDRSRPNSRSNSRPLSRSTFIDVEKETTNKYAMDVVQTDEQKNHKRALDRKPTDPVGGSAVDESSSSVKSLFSSLWKVFQS